MTLLKIANEEDMKNFDEWCPVYSILFTLKGCIFCETLREKINKVLNSDQAGNLMPIVEVGYNDNVKFSNRMGINAFPALVRYYSGDIGPVIFEGERNEIALTEFLSQ
jgi:hypothetical protein